MALPKTMEDTDSTRTSVTASTSPSQEEDNWNNLDVDDLVKGMPDTPLPTITRSKTHDGTPRHRTPRRTKSHDPSILNPPLRRVRTSDDTTTTNTGITTKSCLRKTKSCDDAYPLPVSIRGRTIAPLPSSNNSVPRGRSKSPFHSLGRITTSKSPHRRTPVGRSVSFDKVQVREFQQVLGDAPARDNGPSLGLGWDYHEKKVTNVDKFEAKRTSMFSMGPRRKAIVPALTPKEREDKARKLGFSQEEIQKNRLENLKVNQQRESSLYDRNCCQEEQMAIQDPVAFMMQARAAHGYK